MHLYGKEVRAGRKVRNRTVAAGARARGVWYRLREGVVSAHCKPGAMIAHGREAEQPGLRLIIAGVAGAALRKL